MKALRVFLALFVYLIAISISLASSDEKEKGSKTAMTVNISGKFRLCSADDKGYAYIEVNGGIPPYTITTAPSREPVGQLLENLNPGTYTVIIKDNQGNKMQQEFIVQPPLPLLIEMNEINHADLTAGESGSAKINLKYVNRETVKVEWSNGLKNVLEAKDLKPGSYSVKVYDDSGCASSIHFDIKEQKENFSFNIPTTKSNAVVPIKEQAKSVNKQYTKEELKKIADEIIANMNQN